MEVVNKLDESCYRRCIGSGESKHKQDMIRFVVSPSGQITPDVKGDLPGKGIWVTTNKSILSKVVKNKMFLRFAKMCSVDDSLVSTVEKLLLNRILNLLSLSRRAGKTQVGFEKVKDMLKTGKADIILCSLEKTSSSYNKLLGMSRMLNVKFVDNIDGLKLSKIFDKEIVAFAGIEKCGISKVLKKDVERWLAFQDGEKL